MVSICRSCSEERRAFGKKCLKRLGLALLVICLIALEILSRGAAQIFNYAMANQDMLRARSRSSGVISDITGHAYFTAPKEATGEANPIRDPERRLPRQRLGRPDARLQVDDDTRAHRQSALRLRPPLRRHELSTLVRPRPTHQPHEPEDCAQKVNLATLDARARESRQRRREHYQQKVQRDWHNFNAAASI